MIPWETSFYFFGFSWYSTLWAAPDLSLQPQLFFIRMPSFSKKRSNMLRTSYWTQGLQWPLYHLFRSFDTFVLRTSTAREKGFLGKVNKQWWTKGPKGSKNVEKQHTSLMNSPSDIAEMMRNWKILPPLLTAVMNILSSRHTSLITFIELKM